MWVTVISGESDKSAMVRLIFRMRWKERAERWSWLTADSRSLEVSGVRAQKVFISEARISALEWMLVPAKRSCCLARARITRSLIVTEDS